MLRYTLDDLVDRCRDDDKMFFGYRENCMASIVRFMDYERAKQFYDDTMTEHKWNQELGNHVYTHKSVIELMQKYCHEYHNKSRRGGFEFLASLYTLCELVGDDIYKEKLVEYSADDLVEHIEKTHYHHYIIENNDVDR